MDEKTLGECCAEQADNVCQGDTEDTMKFESTPVATEESCADGVQPTQISSAGKKGKKKHAAAAPAVEVEYECTPRVMYVKELLANFHKALSDEMLEEPAKLNKMYMRCCQDMSRKYKIMMSKHDVMNIYNELVKRGDMAPSYIVDCLTKTKSVRSRSGVLPISVATDGNNFSCAYDCHFCPNECVALGAPRDMSRSYLSSEGTFIRGAIEDWDAAGQVWRRLVELEMMGHPPDKCEMIILGGTWDCYAPAYRDEFIRGLFYACNTYHRMSLRLQGDLSHLTKAWLGTGPFIAKGRFDPERTIISHLRAPLSLEEEKKENENAPCARIIGIVLETRPDQINRHSLIRKRKLGCTRIQLGIQSTDNEVLRLNNRGHGVEESIAALLYARDAGFKVDGHLMPDLPFTTLEKDYKLIKDVFLGEVLQLDYCKLYPCLDLPYTKSREWKEQGVWKPIAEHDFPSFLELLRFAMASVPPWTRVNRVQRDFPEAQEKNAYLGFVSDNIKSNLQQMVMMELEKKGQVCVDIRSREIKTQMPINCGQRARLFVRTYRANGGTEIFLSVELPKRTGTDPDDAVLMGLLRLRLPDTECNIIRTGQRGTSGALATYPKHYLPDFCRGGMLLARIRELHVYGIVQMVNDSAAQEDRQKAQHSGVGRFLMCVAEHVSAMHGFTHCAVISGVGVRDYYRRRGYTMDTNEGEYLVKPLACPHLQPMVLFGRAYTQADLLAALAAMPIPQAYLPTPRITVPDSRPFPLSLLPLRPTTVCERKVYADIQNGEPRLAILHPRPQSTHTLLLLALVLPVLLAIALYFVVY